LDAAVKGEDKLGNGSPHAEKKTPLLRLYREKKEAAGDSASFGRMFQSPLGGGMGECSQKHRRRSPLNIKGELTLIAHKAKNADSLERGTKNKGKRRPGWKGKGDS